MGESNSETPWRRVKKTEKGRKSVRETENMVRGKEGEELRVVVVAEVYEVLLCFFPSGVEVKASSRWLQPRLEQ